MSFQSMLRGYDRSMLSRYAALYYGGSDFFNFGYWSPGTRTQAEASRALVRELLQFFPEKHGNILDVACGLGASTRMLMDYYAPADIVAINVSYTQLERARINAPGCTFRVMDAAHLDFPDASFDNILCVEAAFHFDTREDFLREAYRVLKPGGRLAYSDILFGNLKPKFAEELYLPAANSVPDLASYRAMLDALPFAKAELFDATHECWCGWSGNLQRWPKAEREAGRLGLVDYLIASLVLPRLRSLYSGIVSAYVLVCLHKADEQADKERGQ